MKNIIQHVRKMQENKERRRGAMLVLVLLMLVVLLVMTVFAVDIAYMQLVRTELRTSTDAAARAASEALSRTQSIDAARAAARAVAAQNPVAGQPLQLADSDIVFGSARPNGNGVFRFRAGQNPTNSVRIVGRRTSDSPSGEVPLFMGGILGTPTFEPEMTSSSTSIVRDVALVLDRSGSMFNENKLNDLKAAVAIFLNILDATRAEERVSLTSYSTTGTKDIDMTSNMTIIQNAVNNYGPNGFTAIGQGMAIGNDSLLNDPRSRPFADKAMIVLTDGIENRGPFVNEVLPGVIASEVQVFTITFGSGAVAAVDLMRGVANATGGQHFHAPDGAALRDAFETIARSLAVVMIE